MTKMLTTLTLALALPLAAGAQTIIDASTLRDIEDIDVYTADGEELGEVEAVLVDQSGALVAVVVEVGGFLGIGDDDRVIGFDRLTHEGDRYIVTITRDEVESLPEWDD
jgi:sporulation protein YlmC with PRC-barrel domain